MREILFRGKRVDDGEWVEGHYHCTDYIWQGEEVRRHYILQQNYGDADVIDQSTIGQYTGLTDKNGKKIFEGDILKTEDVVHHDEVQIHGEVFRVGMQKGCWIVIATDTAWDFLYTNTRNAVVIGNIHDNPELMEVTDNA